ncbi:MAG: DUF1553 domain-containing protein [Planctomycetes bacterium]|nr:DUF1553 domain-containing protein [Planctomycetota bacterium]
MSCSDGTAAEAVARSSLPPGPSASPQFARHVVAVLDRLGCNAGACHGSFRGQNGFRLSLFGGDPALDYEGITRDALGRRINRTDPERSLLLLKPTGAVPHGGGLRLRQVSAEYRLLRDWIAAGAHYDPAEPAVRRIEIAPAETVLAVGTDRTRLRVTATYEDGRSSEVTSLSRFEPLDEEVALIDRDGRVSARGAGDTALLVRYAGQVAAAHVLVPRARQPGEMIPGSAYASAGFLDDEINAKLKKLNMTPSGDCSDVEFLRRVSLDLIGTLPTPAEVRSFVADRRPDRRARKIDELLGRPEYAAFWATKFSDWTGNDTRYLANPYRPKQSKQWHDWFRAKLARNVPYREIATGVVTATSCEGRPPQEWQAWAKAEDARLKGKGWDFEYGKRKTLDLLYIKARNLDPDHLALQMAYCFLGVKIECAQCHKHPTDRWTQADFGAFVSAFTYVGVSKEFAHKALPLSEAANNGMTGINEVFHLAEPRKRYTDPRSGRELRPKALGGPELPADRDHDPRVALAKWMTTTDNPFFARALVNRLWAHYFGRGLVEPADALSAANPPSHPALLDGLARRFAASGYDLKALHRMILNSHAYQRSRQANETNRADRRNFSRALVRRLGAEQVIDAVAQATGVPAQFGPGDAPPGTRAIELAPSRLTGPEAYPLTIFGRPQRQQNCDCERSAQPSLPQTLYLFNDAELLDKVRKPGGRLGKLLAEFPDDTRLVEEMYLWVLARWPGKEERGQAVKYLKEGARRERAEDLFWALLNHREFLVNY